MNMPLRSIKPIQAQVRPSIIKFNTKKEHIFLTAPRHARILQSKNQKPMLRIHTIQSFFQGFSNIAMISSSSAFYKLHPSNKIETNYRSF